MRWVMGLLVAPLDSTDDDGGWGTFPYLHIEGRIERIRPLGNGKWFVEVEDGRLFEGGLFDCMVFVSTSLKS
jgi:hypothetical protein